MTRRRDETGLTLVELLVGIVLTSVLAGALSSIFVTGWHAAQPASVRVQESNDAELINTILTRDAQAAGGTDPATQTLDPTLGVSTTDAAGCVNPTPEATLEVRLSWYDRTSVLDQATQAYDVVKHVANYYYVPALRELVRTSCTSQSPAPPELTTLGLPSSQVLAHTIAPIDNATDSADIVCTSPESPQQREHSACTGLPYELWVTLTATNASDNSSPAFTYTVAATVRPDRPRAGGVTGTSLPPLLLLGSRCQNSDHAVLDINGNGNITVNGDVYVNAPPAGCNAFHAGDANFHPTQTFAQQCPPSGLSNCFSLAVSLPDPYASLGPPAGVPADCTGTNPTAVGGVYPAGVYPQPLSLTDTFSFATGGTFIFCQGVSLAGHASVTGTNVLWYFQGGTLSVSGQSNLMLTAPANGPYAGLLIWQPSANTTTPISGQGNISLQGTVYAPSIEVDVAGNGTTPLIAALIAASAGMAGNGDIGIGIPITSPPSLQNWTVNRPYPAATMAASGGQTPYNWSAGGLPAGLTLDPTTGVVSGTPTATGTASAVVTVTDANGLTGTRKYIFTINPTPAISVIALSTWTVNRNYPGTALTVSAGTGTGPFSWSASGLPAGLSINAATGVVAGTPTVTGTVTATFTVTDAAGAIATRSANVTISAAPTITGPSTLPTSTQNVAYPATTILAAQGTTPYTWSASGLPTGMTINSATGVLSGTPTLANTFTATITASDAAGATATRNYTLIINNAVSISTTALPDWTINTPNYDVGVSSGGGTPPYSWTATGLPAGLTINTDTGRITGTPTTLCSPCRINVNVTDNVGSNTSHAYNMNVNAAPTITGPASLASWTVNRTYPGTTITATAGTPNYAWSATGLPSGMTINASSGLISGSPTTLCSPCAVTVTLTDAANATTSQNYSLSINPAPNITTTNLPTGEQNLGYSTTIAAADGTPSAVGSGYTWSASGLPAGLAINTSTGTITGTSTSAGSFSVTITARDAAGATASTTLGLGLAVPPSISGPSILPNWTINRPYPATFITGTGGTAPFTWTATGLPAGLTITPGGMISGTPTATGTFSPVIVKATDALGATATHTYPITISPAPTITTAALPVGAVGASYNATLGASAGTAPYTWTSTALPAGLTLNANTGVISGNPQTTGATDVTITLTDAADATTTRTLTITITPFALALTNVTGTSGGPLTCAAQSSNYTCIWSAGKNVTGATLAAAVSFVDASGNPIVDNTTSAATINLNTPPDGTVNPTSLTVPAGQTTTSATFTLTMSGKKAATTSITFGTNLTLVLTLQD